MTATRSELAYVLVMESAAHHGHSPSLLLSLTSSEDSHGTLETRTSRLPSSQKSFKGRSNLQGSVVVSGGCQSWRETSRDFQYVYKG